jgi:hypothetical protein
MICDHGKVFARYLCDQPAVQYICVSYHVDSIQAFSVEYFALCFKHAYNSHHILWHEISEEDYIVGSILNS